MSINEAAARSTIHSPSHPHTKRNNAAHLTHNGWLPNYHGAWAMITIPPLLGIAFTHARLVHIAFLGTWWIGYFCFFALLMYIKSRFARRYIPALLTYGTLTAICGVAVLVLAPYALLWVIPFLPLIAIAVEEAHCRRERSVLSGFATVLAASLTLPVAAGFGIAAPGTGQWQDILHIPWSIWLCTIFVFLYFAGTVFYVKTNIRERGNSKYLVASLAWHGIALACAGIAAFMFGGWWIAHALLWLVLTFRAWIVPYRAQHGKPLTIMALGMGEVFASIVLAIVWYLCI
ncbi:YwiC-like family protein [Galliscardovia ingluviei]|nr:YwiC-like family protein [Galliscardovia ingluviei]